MAGTLLRTLMEFLMLVTTAAVTIWCRGSVLSYFALRTGKQTKLPAIKLAAESEVPGRGDAEDPIEERRSEEPELDSILSDECQNIFSFGEIRRELAKVSSEEP